MVTFNIQQIMIYLFQDPLHIKQIEIWRFMTVIAIGAFILFLLFCLALEDLL